MSSRFLNRTVFGDLQNAGRVLSRQQADDLLQEWVENERLVFHMRQVGALMGQWAMKREGLGAEGAWRWELAGLLHDADWDKWPEQHCTKIVEELESRGIDPEVIRAIASHGPAHFGVEPVSRMDQMLYAFDELSGLVHAYSLMRPDGYLGMEVKGVIKRLKEKGFAANVSRDDIQDACGRAGIALEELISFVIRHQASVVGG